MVRGKEAKTSRTDSNYQCLGSQVPFMKMLHEIFQDFWNIFEEKACRDEFLAILCIFQDFLNIYKKRLSKVVVLKKIWIYSMTKTVNCIWHQIWTQYFVFWHFYLYWIVDREDADLKKKEGEMEITCNKGSRLESNQRFFSTDNSHDNYKCNRLTKPTLKCM